MNKNKSFGFGTKTDYKYFIKNPHSHSRLSTIKNIVCLTGISQTHYMGTVNKFEKKSYSTFENEAETVNKKLAYERSNAASKTPVRSSPLD